MLEFFAAMYVAAATAFYSLLAKNAPVMEEFESPANINREPEIIELFPAQEEIRKVA